MNGRAGKQGVAGWARGVAAAVLGLAALSAQAAYVVVDTGHTPKQPGATGASGRVEYQYNLDLSGAVATDLLALGDRVTRVSADGAEIALGRRALTAPDADFFISIHHDSMQQKYIDAGRQMCIRDSWSNDRSRYFSRGFTINTFLLDGMPVTYETDTSTYSTTAMYDHVEVVRGPTGLMTGMGDPCLLYTSLSSNCCSTRLTFPCWIWVTRASTPGEAHARVLRVFEIYRDG